MTTSTLSPPSTPPSTLTSSFPQTKENTIRVYKHRASYDHQTIHTILSSTLFSTISFITTSPEDGEPMPFSLPMTAVAGSFPPQNERNQLPENDGSEEEYVRDQEGCPEGGFDVYLHGNSAMLLAKMAKTGSLRVVVSSTKVNGIILHFAPNGHSLNYRSCVIHGDAVPVTSTEEKRYAMQLLTNHMSRRRWSATNPVAPEAMKSLQVVKVVIRSASAKIRATNINGLEKAGFGDRDDVWTGAVPVYEVLGEPVASGYFDESQRPVQRQVEDWMDRRNTMEREYAERVARVGIASPAEVVVKARGGSRARA